MGLIDDYNAKLEEIQAISNDDLLNTIPIPIEHYIHEANVLYNESQKDKNELTASGLDWKVVESLPLKANALSYAESKWLAGYFYQPETATLWKEKSPRIFDLRAELIHTFRFVYRKNSNILALVNKIAASSSYAAMLQDLNDLAVLGKENPGELKTIKFDMALLDEAAELVYTLRPLFAKTKTEADSSELKIIRDKALVLLKTDVDEVCSVGQFIFWRDPARKKIYQSQYLRRMRQKQQKKKNKEAGDSE